MNKIIVIVNPYDLPSEEDLEMLRFPVFLPCDVREDERNIIIMKEILTRLRWSIKSETVLRQDPEIELKLAIADYLESANRTLY